MGGSDSKYPSNRNSSNIFQPVQKSEVPSLSIVSIDSSFISNSDTELNYFPICGDVPEEIFTVVKPIKVESEFGVYTISGTALVKLASEQQQKKKCCGCGCCCGQKQKNMNVAASFDSFNGDHCPTEVFALNSAEDLIIKPTDAFPLDHITTLDMTSSELAAKPKKRRRSLIPEKPDKPLSLWGLIKSAIGKDLTKFPLPVNFAEPLSMLQRLTEDYEYSAVLDKASRMTDSLEQMAYVAAFTVSSYASCTYRTAKPFNPLLGETFECDRTDDLGWRVIAEQVCHHPPIASLHCESAKGWVHWQQFTMKSQFRGTCLEIHPMGVAHLRFKRSDNHYTWHKVTTIIRNLYMGKLYIEQEGEMDIINHTTSERCHMKYTCGGMFSRDRTVNGKVYNKANEVKYEINGTWDTEISATKLDANGTALSEKLLWRKNVLPPDAEKRYNFSTFACQLNEFDDKVAPTDSRNRPDQRFMEDAFWDEANVEKVRLEEKQREAGKARLQDAAATFSTSSKLNTKSVKSTPPPVLSPDDGEEPYYTPCWFTRQRDPLSGQYIYMYNGEYWHCKTVQDWERCPRIYDK